ncbi:MAG: ACT domain-containing protein [Oscillospiraceae bacterium]|nr:ACT domain-containing protein [Oscillospiraceae bacterium]MBR2781847.1 ACT domain-containing protein [Oscillospiraceae bacterium]
MSSNPKYYLVQADALPDVFLKVAEAKRLLESGEVPTVGEATQKTGISRSAFYKYRDSITPFQNLMSGRIITFQLMLKDRTGVLSGILSIFAYCCANILTINQAIPTNGCAMLTISAETTDLNCPVEDLLRKVSNLDGVIKAEMVAG